eukprot:tig00001333_g8203.t1
MVKDSSAKLSKSEVDQYRRNLGNREKNLDRGARNAIHNAAVRRQSSKAATGDFLKWAFIVIAVLLGVLIILLPFMKR